MKGIKKSYILMITFFLFILPEFSQEAQEKIIEEVTVNWWQIPVFALDKKGNPVTDLESGDIQVELKGRQIPEFILYKRSFTVTASSKDMKNTGQLPIKNKVLFFLFDLALSCSKGFASSPKSVFWNNIG
jgi:hypothetical protein